MKNPLCFTLIILTLATCQGCLENRGKVRNIDPGGTALQPMQIGISYYPEQRPREAWNLDFEKLVEAGINRIRIGEFAWSTMEPDEDVFDFSCFDDCIELASRYGLSVVMCTPTAAPPIWLVEKYPDILPVNSEMHRNTFGARQHRCYNAEAYIAQSSKIVSKLAARYANHPNVAAWQIDNEMGGEQKSCYCDNCRDRFHQYLESRYTDIESLNSRWGNAFWSQDYQRFDQIVLPRSYNATLMLKHHPSLELEFSRFCSESIVRFSDMQGEIIRGFNPQAIITTNRFAYDWGDNLDVFDLSKNLNAASFDLYSKEKHRIAFYADLNRSLCDRNNWVMEYGTDSPDLYNEFKLLESRGVQWLFLFKLNPFVSGMEQSNRALLTVTGKPSGNYAVVRKWTREGKSRKPYPAIDPRTGIYYDFDSSWAIFKEEWGSFQERLTYQSYVIDTVYKAFFSPDAPIRIFHSPEGFEKVHTLILAHQIIYNGPLEEALINFIKGGGTVITTNDLFWKNEDNVYMTTPPDIYREIGTPSGDFIMESPVNPILFHLGNGRLIMVPAESGLLEWTYVNKKYNGSL